ncbi:restriction endonuclease subunit S [Halomonas sp. PR-M31]|uniref:restriction endonuclease subunit S n=1 Tax=Halomonas sp. PR-M31 TaxID=1471202 RepID=UPI000651E9AA|nr:restriction endonuclease subunit S [Halomonas sp. PR-M31]
MGDELPRGWQSTELAQAMEAIIDYRGKSPKKTTSGIPLITAKIVKNGRIEDAQEFIATEDYDSWMRRGLPKVGDVLLTTEAPLGEVAQVRDSRIALAQRLIALRGNDKTLDNSFLKYLLQSAAVQNELLSRSTGTTVVGIKQRELRKITLQLPPIDEQRTIADILGTLDDKIELNRQMNGTLEAMARAIFKAWFVDFEPVKAKAAGATGFRGMPQAVFDQLPDRFTDSELGPVPEGWEYAPIGELVDVIGGGTPSTKNPDFWEGGEHAFCTPKDMSRLSTPVILDTDRYITQAGVDRISSGQLPIGTVILSSRAPIGYLALAETLVSVNQGIIAMVTGEIPNTYILLWTEANMKAIESRAGGSTFAEISKKNFRQIPALRPDDTTLFEFGNLANPFFKRIASNERETQTLTAIRDTLLPELISGKLRVPAAEREANGR